MENINKITENQFGSSVERNKAASRLCMRLFPAWTGSDNKEKQVIQGELQRVIVKAWETGIDDNETILETGLWWLWARNLMIDNTFTKQQRERIMEIAVSAADGLKPVNFVITRSPELLHAQVEGTGNSLLPRTRVVIEKFAQIVNESKKHLRTSATILLADLAITNIDELAALCDTESVLRNNVVGIERITQEAGLSDFEIIRISDLSGPRGKLGEIISANGKTNIELALNAKARIIIETAVRESIGWHKDRFGWDVNKTREHNFNLAITMGLVGEALRQNNDNTVLIHNESFISRGPLNNIFNDPKDPLPVICLRDLLARKGGKD